MAIEFVGSVTKTSGDTVSYLSLDGTLTGGIASSPAPGDLVLVFFGDGGNAVEPPASVSGNNTGSFAATDNVYSNDSWDTNFRGFYAVQGATVDTNLTFTRYKSVVSYHCAIVVMVWRGVDTTTPMDVTPTAAASGASDTCLFNAPSITPVTSGAIIIAAGAGTMSPADSTEFTGISGMGNFATVLSGGAQWHVGTAAASVAWSGGSYDPATVAGGAPNTSSAWSAMTFALRPASVSADTLSGQNIALGSPVIGSPSMGQNHALTGQSAAVAAPAVTAPALGQTHALTGQSASVASLTVSSPALDVVDTEDALTGQNAALGSPTVTLPAIGQIHVLGGDGVGVSAPTVSASALGQVHALAAQDVVTGAPQISMPGAIAPIDPSEVARIVRSSPRVKTVVATARRREVSYEIS